jgi:hypothetical protein
MSSNQNMVFVEYQEPGLKAGDYRVSAELSVKNLTGAVFADAAAAGSTYQVEKYLRVSGDRYTLSVGSVDSVYPPHGTSGNYNRCMPHVVLRRPTLPWERTIADDAAPHTPWMTVLVLSDDELIAEGIDPAHPLTPAIKPDDDGPVACSVLSISGDRWSALAPSAEDLIYLAHVRKSAPDRRNDTDETELKFSLVVANRMPPPDKACSAFLVSLENMAGKLYPAKVDGKVELVVLHAWRFFAEKERDNSFGRVIQELDRSVGLSLPGPGDGDAAKPLSMGYIPVSHDLRVGGRTWSWYRGPFTPYATERVLNKDFGKPAASADSLLFYDPELGMMDASCAAAWTLNDTAFANAVLKSRGENVQHTLERARFQMSFGKLPGVARVDDEMRAQADENIARGLLGALNALGGAAPSMAEELGSRCLVDEAPAAPVEPLSCTDRTRYLNQALTQEARIAELHCISERVDMLRGAAPDAAEVSPKETWLGNAALMKGVPVHYFIPHEAMLPTESIRFFQVDLSWLEAFRDGALSLGRNSGTDTSHDAAFMPLLRLGTEKATSVARPQNRRLLARKSRSAPSNPLSGFLLRSEALTDWPDMEVQGRVGEKVVGTLRQQIVGPILICLFDQVVDRVDIHQPAQAVHFGFLPKGDPSGVAKYWRKPTGEEDKAKSLKDIPYRDSARGVLNIAALCTASGSSRSDQFALQMVSGVDRVVFRIDLPQTS